MLVLKFLIVGIPDNLYLQWDILNAYRINISFQELADFTAFMQFAQWKFQYIYNFRNPEQISSVGW